MFEKKPKSIVNKELGAVVKSCTQPETANDV